MTTAATLPVTPARLVLDHHTDLHQRFVHPTPLLLRFFDEFMTEMIQHMVERQGVTGDDHIAQVTSDVMGQMFYPAEDAEQVCRALAQGLSVARTYQVTAEMMDAVSATYQASIDHVMNVEEAELPAEAGFVWLDKLLEFDSWDGKPVRYRALTWSMVTVHTDEGHLWPAVRLTTWFNMGDPEIDDLELNDSASRIRAQLAELGPLVLAHTQVLMLGERFHASRDWDVTLGNVASWAHTLWMFMDTEITTSHEAPVERPARKRAMRSLKHTDVNVVLLRRSHGTGERTGEGHRVVDWSCRWVVQGFYRHLESYTGAYQHHHALPAPWDRDCCLTCAARITWVRPHLRGPSDKPLRGAEQLYRLSR